MAIRYFLPFLIGISILYTSTLSAQTTDVLLTNSKKVDKKRYKDIKGSPYLLEEWYPGIIISREAERIEVAALNYNAYTNTFEVKQEERFIELDPTWYEQIILHSEGESPATFQKGIHPSLKGNFTQILYKGKGQLYKQSESKISKKTFHNVGKTIHVEQFVRRTTYHWVEGDAHKSFKLNKKSIVKSLGKNKGIDSYLKKNKLKLNKEEHLVKLFSFLDGASN